MKLKSFWLFTAYAEKPRNAAPVTPSAVMMICEPFGSNFK